MKNALSDFREEKLDFSGKICPEEKQFANTANNILYACV